MALSHLGSQPDCRTRRRYRPAVIARNFRLGGIIVGEYGQRTRQGGIGGGVVGVDLNRPIEIIKRAVEVSSLTFDKPSIVVSLTVARIEL